MGRRLLDITGLRFGKLVVLNKSEVMQGNTPMWKCICDCGNEKLSRSMSLRTGYTTSCGCSNRKRGPVHTDASIRFYNQIYYSIDGCHYWIGSLMGRNYGCFSVNHKSVRANRYSYLIHRGPIPQGMYVCHTCDNPLCVNPDHLFLGTPLDNMLDKCRKGRQAKGPEHRRLIEIGMEKAKSMKSS